MTAWSLDNASLLAHGVHYALVVGGLVGVAWLLVPQLVPGSLALVPRDDHDRRVAALREAIASGRLLTSGPTTARAHLPREVALLLPLALTASTAAAGVHAAMGPLHFREATLFGLFFAASALAQLAWTAAALRAVTPDLLVAGLALNAGCALLWAVTRLWGLPLGLMPVREPVGPWDLAAVAWELVVVVACVALLRHTRPTAYAALRLPPWVDWHRGAAAVAAASVLLLLALSLSGAGG